MSGREDLATASGLIGSGPELPASAQKENIPDKPGMAQQGPLFPRKTPWVCPPQPGIHGTEQRDPMSCSLSGSDSTWKKDPSSQRFSTLQSSLLVLPSALSQTTVQLCSGTRGPESRAQLLSDTPRRRLLKSHVVGISCMWGD